MKTKAVTISEIEQQLENLIAGEYHWLDYPVLRLFDEYTSIQDEKTKRAIQIRCLADSSGCMAFIDHDKKHGLVWHTVHFNGLAYKKPIAKQFDNPFSRPAETVYFVGCEGFVKIGFTRGSAAQRIKNLQTSNPQKLELLATEYGGVTEEREMHAEFAEYRVSGEWFRNEGRLARRIELLAGSAS